MSIYPFTSGYKVLYESDTSSVVFGYSEITRLFRVGIEWVENNEKNIANYPKRRQGASCYFEISQEFELGFLASLLNKNGTNNQNVIEAMEKLNLQAEKR